MAISTLNVAGTIILGDVEFVDFEMPEVVRYVPGQNSIIHKFIGGARQIDQMGLDYDIIKFSGTFLSKGQGVAAKIDTLQAYVEDAGELELTFNDINYHVTIKSITFDHRSDKWTDYAIELYVIQDGQFQNPKDAGTKLQNFGAATNLNNAAGILNV